jgi:hypothetical protein
MAWKMGWGLLVFGGLFIAVAFGQQPDTLAEYKKFPEYQKKAYVVGVIEGFRGAFAAAGQNWPKATVAAFKDCPPVASWVLELLEDMDEPEYQQIPVRQMAFRAYGAACEIARKRSEARKQAEAKKDSPVK